jgi:integrase
MPKPTTPKVTLTDRYIRSRKPAASGQRDEFRDAVVPALRLRVTDRGHKSFALVGRFPLSKHPARRALGDVYLPPQRKPGEPLPPEPAREIRNGALTLGEARAKAREWLDQLARGIDPKVAAERERVANLRSQANTWTAVVADFLDQHAKGLTKRHEAKAILERELGRKWAIRPITDISPLEVSSAIKAIKDRGSPYQAHNAFGWVRLLYSWAIGTGLYGLTSSPTERLRPSQLIGKREPRERTLDETELRQVWDAAGTLGYPYGDMFRMLILTGQRKLEVGEMSWDEVDLDKALWTIPAERMKGDRAHEVPLAHDALALLTELDRLRRDPPKPDANNKGAVLALWDKGKFVFSTSRGAKPVNGYTTAKSRLDHAVAVLRAEARSAKGTKPEHQDQIPAFVVHDLRRTMRTGLSALSVQDLVRELVIAHAKPGLHKTYDRHSYRDEKRHCLDLWEKRLKTIVDPPPAGVADLAKARAKRSKRGADAP